MSDEEDLAAVQAVAPMPPEDVAGFIASSHEERVAQIQGLIDAGVVQGPSAFDKMLAVMGTIAKFAGMVSPVGAAVSMAFAIGKL
jgi:hypothetical protein